MPAKQAPGQIPTCPAAPEPVLALDYESRYQYDDVSRSRIDTEADAKTDAALAPLDDFIRSLADQANSLALPETDRAYTAACVTSQIADWARAGALRDLQTETAKLTIGARLAGFGMVLRQTMPHGGKTSDLQLIRTWLTDLARPQMIFWEEEAPEGAKTGNLRAWAALGMATIADVTEDPVIRGWSAWSADYVLCTANTDGSLPQEMTRGRLAYHYQLHAVAPLVVSARVLADHGIEPGLHCDDALDRVVKFTLDDLESGTQTQAITGEQQSYFDGSRELTGYNLAWLPAYRSLRPEAAIAESATRYTAFASSKLGGDQSLVWNETLAE